MKGSKPYDPGWKLASFLPRPNLLSFPKEYPDMICSRRTEQFIISNSANPSQFLPACRLNGGSLNSDKSSMQNGCMQACSSRITSHLSIRIARGVSNESSEFIATWTSISFVPSPSPTFSILVVLRSLVVVPLAKTRPILRNFTSFRSPLINGNRRSPQPRMPNTRAKLKEQRSNLHDQQNCFHSEALA